MNKVEVMEEQVFIDEEWTMANGEKIYVKDMTESHVRDALRMVLKEIRQEEDRCGKYDCSIEDTF